MSEKKIFEFKNGGNTFLIKDVRTPRYWSNHLWSEHGYVAQVTQIGHGMSYYINDKADMCKLNANEARYVYLRDDDNNVSWNVGEGPLLEPVENYSCEHTLFYSVLESEKNGVRVSWRIFVPFDGFHEVWTLKVINNSNKKRKLSIFSAVNFELEGFKYPRFYEMYRCCETFYNEELKGIFCLSKHPFAPHKRYNGYIASSEEVYASEGNLEKFFGSIGSFQRPEIILKGRDLTNSVRTCYSMGGVLQNKIELLPGEEKILHFVYGISESLEGAVGVAQGLFSGDGVEKKLMETIEHQQSEYQNLSVKTPDEKINNIMNNWLKRQVEFCLFSKKGVRDNLQISGALMMYRTEKAKAEILEVLKHQFRDGYAVLTWYPYDDTRYSDQPFWIVWAVIEIIKETGDFSILDAEVEYQDGGKGTVLEHMKAGTNRLLEDKGPNGLTKIFFADWNDALNITDDPEAESVMLSQQLCLAMKELSILCERIGDLDYAAYLKDKYGHMRQTINEKAWDGEWYARALSKLGNIGARDSWGSKIYVNAQVWAVLAGIPDEERLPMVLKAIDGMEHDFGFPINLPAYPEYSDHVGRMGGMLSGLYENGGVYCHASAFKMVMDCKVGRAEEALRTLHKLMPDNEYNPYTRSETEPFMFTNCYSLSPGCYGKADRGWRTGTSAWVMKGLYEGLLGIQREYDGLKIDPCFPAKWDRAEAVRTFRKTRYHIVIENPEHISKGKVHITVDGKEISGDILPCFDDGKIHEVKVLLSKS